MEATLKLHYCTDIPIQYRYRKIKSVIAALGLPVVDVPRETFADLRNLSPIPTLPLLETSEGNFTSSNTIIRYLGAKAGYKLYGGDNLYERALIDQWLDLTQCDFDTCAIAINLYLDGKEVDIESVTADAEKFLTHLNKHLKNRKFIVGNSLTIADLAIAATIGPVISNMYGEEERRKYSLISTWYHSITQQNKQIEPKELPKKIHKKFEKKKDKQEKGPQTKDQKQKQVKGKQKQKTKQVKQEPKQKEGGKQKKDKKNNKKAKEQQKPEEVKKTEEKKPEEKKAEVKKAEEDDLFGDDPVEEKPKIPVEPAPKKVVDNKKKKPAAKSIVIFNVKVYEEKQDLQALGNKIINQITMENGGLVWNKQFELQEIAYGMKMLKMGCVIEDDKVSIEEDIYPRIQAWDKVVQSIDTVSFQKL